MGLVTFSSRVRSAPLRLLKQKQTNYGHGMKLHILILGGKNYEIIVKAIFITAAKLPNQ